jgi:Ala-tRNA(Pro) deacylase
MIMAMATTLRDYLASQDVDFEELSHPRDVSASRIAEQAHISGEQVAKAILIKGDSGYRVVLVPSTCKADLMELSHQFHERLGLATEEEIRTLFDDCEPGVLPALAQAWGVRVCCDDTLMSQPDLYLEAGDHETLVHMGNSEFRRLMARAEHGQFSRHL